MPTYDYRCTACKHEFEHFQSMKDKTLKKCPECGKNALERLIGTGAAVIFKGSGFYQTDYRPDAYKKAAEADKAPTTDTAKTDSKADNKADSKTETKSESKADNKSDSKSESKSDNKPSAKPDSKSKDTKKTKPAGKSGE